MKRSRDRVLPSEMSYHEPDRGCRCRAARPNQSRAASSAEFVNQGAIPAAGPTTTGRSGRFGSVRAHPFLRTVALVFLSLLALASCGESSPEESFNDLRSTLIEGDAACAEYLRVNGDSVTIQTVGYSSGDSFERLEEAAASQECLFGAVDLLTENFGFSGALHDRILSTRALDGTQEAGSDGYNAYWTYHPDNGTRLIVEAAG